MPRVYRVTAYRPDGVDTCRGCVMESWYSDYVKGEWLTHEEAVEKLVHLLRYNDAAGPGPEYEEIEVMEEEVTEYDALWKEYSETEPRQTLTVVTEACLAEARARLVEIQAAEALAAEAARRAKEVAERLAAERRAAATEARERALLAQLKQKYE